MTADLRANLGAARLAGEQRRHRHVWGPPTGDGRVSALAVDRGWVQGVCVHCGAVKDEAKSRRGRSSRNRGNRRELEIAKRLGGEKVGQYGTEVDVRTPLLVIQSKVRKAFPGWMVEELHRLPRTGGRLPALVVTDAPGSGITRRSIVVMELADFEDLHGRAT